jgi:hypothetical protein
MIREMLGETAKRPLGGQALDWGFGLPWMRVTGS